MIKFPKKLRNSPLVGFACEMRVSPIPNASSLMLASFYSKYGKSLPVVSTNVASIPEGMRKTDPNFQCLPLLLVDVEEFKVGLSDSSIIIMANGPYPGWARFKTVILDTFKFLFEDGSFGPLSRCSIKYTNILEQREGDTTGIALELMLNAKKFNDKIFQLRFERISESGEFVSIVALASAARADLPDLTQKIGPFVEIDSICLNMPEKLGSRDFEVFLERLHDEARSCFFECISKEALNYMEPEYEYN